MYRVQNIGRANVGNLIYLKKCIIKDSNNFQLIDLKIRHPNAEVK